MSTLLEQIVKVKEINEEKKKAADATTRQTREMELKKAEQFRKTMRQVQQQQQLELQRIREKEQEKKAEQAKRDKQKKIADLRTLIAKLKSRLASSGFDQGLANQISQLETELYSLLFSL